MNSSKETCAYASEGPHAATRPEHKSPARTSRRSMFMLIEQELACRREARRDRLLGFPVTEKAKLVRGRKETRARRRIQVKLHTNILMNAVNKRKVRARQKIGYRMNFNLISEIEFNLHAFLLYATNHKVVNRDKNNNEVRIINNQCSHNVHCMSAEPSLPSIATLHPLCSSYVTHAVIN